MTVRNGDGERSGNMRLISKHKDAILTAVLLALVALAAVVCG